MAEIKASKFNQPIEACICGNRLSCEKILSNKAWLFSKMSCYACVEAQNQTIQILDKQWKNQEERITTLENMLRDLVETQ